MMISYCIVTKETNAHFYEQHLAGSTRRERDQRKIPFAQMKIFTS